MTISKDRLMQGMQRFGGAMYTPVILFAFFGLAVAVAIICKIIGCGAMGLACRFSPHDSLKIGVGMMTRGEVALIVSQKGLSVGMIGSEYFAAVILLIVVSSISTPILLKALYAADDRRKIPA